MHALVSRHTSIKAWQPLHDGRCQFAPDGTACECLMQGRLVKASRLRIGLSRTQKIHANHPVAEDLADYGETGMTLEPLIPEELSRHRPRLDQLATELVERSSNLARDMPDHLRLPLTQLMRYVECYHMPAAFLDRCTVIHLAAPCLP